MFLTTLNKDFITYIVSLDNMSWSDIFPGTASIVNSSTPSSFSTSSFASAAISYTFFEVLKSLFSEWYLITPEPLLPQLSSVVCNILILSSITDCSGLKTVSDIELGINSV